MSFARNITYRNGRNSWRPEPSKRRGPSGEVLHRFLRLKHLERYAPCWAATYHIKTQGEGHLTLTAQGEKENYLYQEKQSKYLSSCGKTLCLWIDMRKGLFKPLNINFLFLVPLSIFQEVCRLQQMLALTIELNLGVTYEDVSHHFFEFFNG